MEKLNLEEILSNSYDLNKKKYIGYVSIIGRPNTGKSTFINTLIGEKISITTQIPQTTRKKILAIYNDEDSQIIFFDTPGIHKSGKKFNQEINQIAISSLDNTDLILYFIDSSREFGNEENYIKNLLSQVSTPILKVLTKSDLKPKIDTSDGIKISSVSKKGFSELLSETKKYLKNGPILFPEEYYTKQDIYFRISEIIREKVFLKTKDEIPHSIDVKVEEMEEKEDLLKIVAYILTETDSQKYIIIGKGGTLISQIGKMSRVELEEIFGKKVFLALRVKTEKNWKNKS